MNTVLPNNANYAIRLGLTGTQTHNTNCVQEKYSKG